jgi:hypothetical protein
MMSKLSRRAFARDAVVAATAAAVLPNVLAQTPPAATEKPAPLPIASQAEVDARVNWIFTKYGARLDETQRADIRRIISGGQKDVDAMRAWPLPSSAEPAAPFRIHRRRS